MEIAWLLQYTYCISWNLKEIDNMLIHLFALALAAVIGAAAVRRLHLDDTEAALCFLLYIHPFLSGGFYPYSWALTSCVLVALLWHCARRQGCLQLRFGDPILALLLLTVSSGASVFWAVDRGMAVWGIVRYVPVLLFALALMQLPAERVQRVWALVPLSGVVMTVLSGCMQYIPGMEERYTVAGRLAGFFEYPNAFAAFLLAGLVLSVTAGDRSKWSWAADLILIYGVFDSGSRTGFVLLAVVLLVLLVLNRRKRAAAGLAAAAVCCAVLVGVLSLSGLDSSVGRFLAISLNSSTMLGRFLYFRDALAVILRYPLGLGYLGYRALQGAFQTGVYDVAYVHNGLLQLLLDVGWVPALAMVYVAVRSFLRRGGTVTGRLLLAVILGHSMMDFDLEFLSMWLLLLPALGLDEGTALRLRGGRHAVLAAAGVLTCVCIWLAAGDAFFRAGRIQTALAVTPFHTQALEYRLTQLTDLEELEQSAQRLLRLNERSTLGHSALANAAFAAGDIMTMIEEKQAAIACSRYDLEEYCDYLRKLYEAMCWYQGQNDHDSARICASLMLEIPQILEQVRQETTALAWKLDDRPQLELPAEYRQLLAAASSYIDPAK